MGKPISISSSVTVNIGSYSGNNSYVSTGTSYPPSNGIKSSGTTSGYAAFSGNSTNNAGYAYYKFETITIPAGATITSVSCTARSSLSNTSRGTSGLQLMAGSTTKGSETTVNSTTSTAYNLTPGSWTAEEINQGVTLRIRVTRTSNNQSFAHRFYGATLTVNYSYEGYEYTISSMSNVDGITTAPDVQDVYSGDDAIVEIFGDSLDNITVEDNGTDVTDLLVETTTPSTGSVESVPQSTFTTGVSSSNAAFYVSSSNSTIARLQDPIGHTAENPASQPSSNQWTYVKDNNQNTANGWIIFDFDFSSIPLNATITGVEVKCYGAKENTSTGTQYMSKVGLYAGTTLKSTEQEFTSTNPYIMTINNPGSWTVSELQDAKLRHTVAYYGGWIGGISWTVTYTLPSTKFWLYTLTSVATDHTIIVKEAIIIPPDEDPQKEYYPVTISSINASTDPRKGTVRIESGDSQMVYIYPDDPQLTLAYDNGVDISSRLVSHHGEQATSAITTAPGASYGFVYSSSTGYYVSNNKGVDKSAAVSIITLNLPVRCLVTIEYINYAEATYDFGIFGNVDVPLNTNYYVAGSGGATITDSNYKLACNTSAYNSSTVRTLTYEIDAGEHSIYVKYSKDDATSSNNDTLQFRITSIEELESNLYYTYDLTNINSEHSLIFIFGDVSYYFVESSIHNASTSGCKLFPSGQMVQMPGDNYTLTVVPDNETDTVTVTDNGIDVSNSLQRKEVETEKEGVTSVTVNFVYTLSNIQTGHTLVVRCTKAIETVHMYLKESGSWENISRAYIKNGNRWEEVSDLTTIFTDGKLYISDLQ